MVLMVLIEWDSHYIFNQIFSYHIIFCQSHGKLGGKLLLFSQITEKTVLE